MSHSCACDAPRESPNPRRKGWCAKCLKRIDPDCLSTNKTTEEFFDRLRWAMFPSGKVSPRFERFRRLCEDREKRGREVFGVSYLGRENEQEAAEEAADLAMYLHLAILQSRHRGEDEEWSVALEAARHAFIAFEFAMEHALKRKGTP